MSKSKSNVPLQKEPSASMPNQRQRSRYKRNSRNPPPVRLRQRDLDILNTLKEYRFLTALQIKALFFNSIHKARKRLFLLWQNKYLERVFLPPAMGEGSPFAIYALGPSAIRLLISHAGLDREDIGKTIPKSPGSYLFIEHTLRRNDFRIALTLSSVKGKEPGLLFWKQDKSIKTEINIPNLRRGLPIKTTIFPDGFFGIRFNDKDYYFFLEVDRGTVGSKRMRLRFMAYHQLWLQRLCLKRYGIHNFRVLTVTASRPRLESLIKAAGKDLEGDLGSNLFLFTTFDQYELEDLRIFTRSIWRPTDSKENACVSLLGRPAESFESSRRREENHRCAVQNPIPVKGNPGPGG